MLGIHISTFKRIYKHYRATGEVTLPKNNADRPNLISETGYEQIKEWVLSKPTLLLKDIQENMWSKIKNGLCIVFLKKVSML